MTKSKLVELVREDEKVYGDLNWLERLITPGLRLSKAYRKTKYYSSHKNLKLIGMFYRIYYHHLCVKYGCDIPSSVVIDSGMRIFHPYGIVINSGTTIGNNFTIAGETVRKLG